MILKINNQIAESREMTSQACVMVPGDIVFVSGTSMLSKLIQRAEKSQISHSALAIDSKRIMEAGPFGRAEVKPMHYKTYILKRADLTKEQRKAVIRSAMNLTGYKFNYAGTFIWFLRLLFKYPGIGKTYHPKRLWCSELIDRAYQNVGIDLVPGREPGDVIPPDLMKSPLLHEVCRQEQSVALRASYRRSGGWSDFCDGTYRKRGRLS